MEVRTYNLTKETSALLTCIEQCTELHSNIFDALTLSYDESQIDTGGRNEEHKIGNKIFESIETIQKELFAIMETKILENLYLIEQKEKNNI